MGQIVSSVEVHYRMDEDRIIPPTSQASLQRATVTARANHCCQTEIDFKEASNTLLMNLPLLSAPKEKETRYKRGSLEIVCGSST